ncbi:hypothetical protein Q7C36_007395 [Tachysurus vachellii]|uniref:Uncharacterized protein n=1 Tax=Tachysurus vachellii TaxID=175792 RepID=A0AA88SVQ9_TACVA|nr:hypothetical protein Q7C36_007395 [Tachysurus vachellii]
MPESQWATKTEQTTLYHFGEEEAAWRTGVLASYETQPQNALPKLSNEDNIETYLQTFKRVASWKEFLEIHPTGDPIRDKPMPTEPDMPSHPSISKHWITCSTGNRFRHCWKHVLEIEVEKVHPGRNPTTTYFLVHNSLLYQHMEQCCQACNLLVVDEEWRN